MNRRETKQNRGDLMEWKSELALGVGGLGWGEGQLP